MTIRVLYFAGLRESLDCAEESLALPDTVCSVEALRAHLAGRGGLWPALARAKAKAHKVLCANNGRQWGIAITSAPIGAQAKLNRARIRVSVSAWKVPLKRAKSAAQSTVATISRARLRVSRSASRVAHRGSRASTRARSFGEAKRDNRSASSAVEEWRLPSRSMVARP